MLYFVIHKNHQDNHAFLKDSFGKADKMIQSLCMNYPNNEQGYLLDILYL